METDAAAVRTRPRLWLLILLGVTVASFVAMKLWPSSSATPPVQTSNSRPSGKGQAQTTIDPESLDVRLDELKAQRPGPGEAERNPFRFQPKPPPPPPPAPPGGRGTNGPVTPPAPVQTAPAQPPPIPLKFFGIVEKPGFGKVAAFTDCRATYYGREGEIVVGQYRLVKIGIESVVMEYVDGRGRMTIRLSGQECVNK